MEWKLASQANPFLNWLLDGFHIGIPKRMSEAKCMMSSISYISFTFTLYSSGPLQEGASLDGSYCCNLRLVFCIIDSRRIEIA